VFVKEGIEYLKILSATITSLGLKICISITEFDLVTLFDNGIALSEEEFVIPQKILHIANGKVLLLTNDYPAWVKPVIDKFQEIVFE
jgi:hypothetical protein